MKNCEYFDLVSDPSVDWICTKCFSCLALNLPDMAADSHLNSSPFMNQIIHKYVCCEDLKSAT